MTSQPDDVLSNALGVPPLLHATWLMDQTVGVFRRHIEPPFAPALTAVPVGDYMNEWYRAEAESRQECEAAVAQWLEARTLPVLGDAAAYFLCHRFDQASDFLQNLFLWDQTTVFSCGDLSLDEVLRWVWVEWWQEHGSRMAWELEEGLGLLNGGA